MFCALGLVLFWVGMRVPPQKLRMLAAPLLLIGIVLLVAVLIPGLGALRGGSRAWFVFGPLSLQPSEGVKVALTLWGAHVLALRRNVLHRWKHALSPVVPVSLLIFVLLILQPDLGMTVSMGMVLVALLFFAGAPAAADGRGDRRRPGRRGDPRPDRGLPAGAHRRVPLAGDGGPARPRLPGHPGAVLARRRRPVRRGARPGPGQVELPAERPQRLHLRDHRRGAGLPRGVRGARAVRHAGLHRPADRRAQRRPVAAYRRRHVDDLAGRPGRHQHRLRRGAAAGDRAAAAADLLGRNLARGHHVRLRGAGQRGPPRAGGHRGADPRRPRCPAGQRRRPPPADPAAPALPGSAGRFPTGAGRVR